MQKVLIVHNKYKIKGGEDTNFAEEVNFLKSKYKLEQLIFENSERLNFFDFIAFFTFSNRNSNQKLSNLLSEFQPDLIYIHNTWFKANLGIFKVLKKEKINVAIKIHNFRYNCGKYFLLKNHLKNDDICTACSIKKKKFKLFNKYFNNSYLQSIYLIIYSKKFFKILRDNPIKILAINKFHEKKLIEYGIPENKIEILYNPFLQNNNKDSYNVKSNYIVYAGRLTKSKGVEELLATWIESGISGLFLKIIGTGEELEYLTKKYSNSNIEFLGELDNKQTVNIISKSKAIVTATKMLEGQPRIFCEAFANQIPVIFPSFGGMDEYFPVDYKLKFEQFNYDSLKSIFKILNNKSELQNISRELNNHVNKEFNEDILHSRFQTLLN